MSKIKSIGIVSPNFGGSTIFGYLMQGYSGIHHVGESWKILPPRNEVCKEDGQDCPYFTPKNIKKIIDSDHFYNSMPELFNCNTIITGDKNPSFYSKKTTTPDILIVLLKNPYAHTYSFFKRLEKSEDHKNMSKTEKIIEAATNYYTTIVDRLAWALKLEEKNNVPVYVISFEDFIVCNTDEKNELAVKMSLDTKFVEANIDENMHYIGGNHKLSNGGSGEGKVYFQGKIKEDNRYKDVFSQEDIDTIKQTLDSFQVLKNHLSKSNVLTNIDWLDNRVLN